MQADIAMETTSDYLVDTFPGYERLLRAGTNVITLACESTYAAAANPEVGSLLDALAKANNVTFAACCTLAPRRPTGL